MPNLEHDVFDFLLKALLNLLGLHYQGNGIASPFQAHPLTMGIASASLLLYCISYELEPRFTQVGRGGMGLFRSILFVSLASLLLRNPVWVVLYFSYILFANWEMLCSVIEVVRSWVHQRMVLLLYRAMCWINWRWFVVPVYANPVYANRGNILPRFPCSSFPPLFTLSLVCVFPLVYVPKSCCVVLSDLIWTVRKILMILQDVD
ncbi:hypothetical protein RHSIM_Rhsim07G0114400 [Rhododendron simsii]|uniref:Uncharacterized protein n=1 Tax=Rhododendron simsii TaxID=118357 RepID=A0A834GP06_RHOSS|nr:hypothetical protein RHSIM_Rhsim07G0114400 [Rhododendron simsii]